MRNTKGKTAIVLFLLAILSIQGCVYIPTEVVEEPKVNLALGAAATASSVYLHFTPDRAVDGDKEDQNSRWLSEPGYPQWISVDLGQRETIHMVALYFFVNEHGFVYYNTEYEIQYSEEGTWKTILHVEDNQLQAPVHSFPPVVAQQIRILFHKGIPQADLVRLYELEIY